MKDYYKILGVPRSSGEEVIKAAFKKLAIKFHPDKNPGNSYAEEQFKLVNEAYQTLSNTAKKARYDSILNYTYRTEIYTKTAHSSSPGQQKDVYNRYGKYNWRNAPKYKKRKVYVYDKEYFKNQFLALVVISIIAAIIMGVQWYDGFSEEQKIAAMKEDIKKRLSDIRQAFQDEKYEEALTSVTELEAEYPYEGEIDVARNQLIENIRQVSESSFANHEYQQALDGFNIIKDVKKNPWISVYHRIATCQKELALYNKAVITLDFIMRTDLETIDLNMEIGDIYMDRLNQPNDAIRYYDRAKIIFKEHQTQIYGEAFELVIQPEHVPDLYFDVFMSRARANMELGNSEEALTDYNWAISLRPDRNDLYLTRGNLKLARGETHNACMDWYRALERGNTQSRQMINRHCNGISSL